MTKLDDQIKIWKEWTNKNMDQSSLKLNPNKKTVESLTKTVLSNEKKYGFKFCPCRIQTKNKKENMKLICPCNFQVQKTWEEKGECWCSLFVKKK